MTARIADNIFSIPEEERNLLNQRRWKILKEALHYFVRLNNGQSVPTTFTNVEQCFLDALFSTCSRDLVEKFEMRNYSDLGDLNFIIKAKAVLPMLFENFLDPGLTIDDRLEVVKTHIDKINPTPNLKGVRMLSKTHLDELQRELVQREKVYNESLDALERVADNDADGGRARMWYGKLCDTAEKDYNAVLTQIPKNYAEASEIARYAEKDYYIYDDYILTPSLCSTVCVQVSAKDLIFNQNFLLQFAMKLVAYNIGFEDVRTVTQDVLMDLFQVCEVTNSNFQQPNFSQPNQD